MDNWITLTSVLLSLVVDTAATYCRVETQRGTEFVFCYQKCCEGYYRTRYDVCCTYEYPTTGMIVGGGVGLIVVVATLLLCCFYVVCKKQLRRRNRLQNHSRVLRRNTIIPTVSETVTTVSPPSYEEISLQPPPYTADNLAFVDEQPSLPVEQRVYPDHPPPKYSKSDKFPPKTK